MIAPLPPLPSSPRTRFTGPCVALAVATLFSGCVSSQYQLAKPATAKPALALNLTVDQPPVAAVLHSVIVYQGPGSWKRAAYWDEYVLTLTNRGPTPLLIETATLTDFQGTATPPGEDPWKLEDLSKTWWEKARSSQTGNLLVLGAGTVGVTGALLAAAIVADGGFLAPATAAGGALATAAAVTLVAAPIYAVTVVVINSQNKEKVLTEYHHRRHALPLALPPGQSATGSLFFRLSPGPQRLTLRCRTDSAPFEVPLNLAPLSGLHLTAPTPPPTPAQP